MSSPNSPRDVDTSTSSDYLPTAPIDTLRKRAALLQAVRAFFQSRGYWEVETPTLSHDVVVDAHLEPFIVPAAGSTSGGKLYLQTSPEFGMKRLLAAGADAIFQITRAFRREEQGQFHNPEFTMVEWYRTGDTHVEQMALVEDLVVAVFDEAKRVQDAPPSNRPAVVTPFARMTYDEAFEQFAGTRVLALETNALIALTKKLRVQAPESLAPDDRDGWLNLLLAEVVEPRIRESGPTFLYDYPASQAALARVRRDSPPVAERFELYIAGIELCNGYHELADAAELRARMRVQAKIRAADRRATLPDDNRLLAAMQAGLPNCSGVALGFDRLAMLALGAEKLADVMAFPFDRA